MSLLGWIFGESGGTQTHTDASTTSNTAVHSMGNNSTWADAGSTIANITDTTNSNAFTANTNTTDSNNTAFTTNTTDSNNTAFNSTSNNSNAFTSTSANTNTNSGNTVDSHNTYTQIVDGGSIDMAGKVAVAALNFGGDALASNNKALTSVLNFAGDTVGNSLSFADRQAARTNQAQIDALQNSLNFANDQAARQSANEQAAFADSLSFANTQNNKAIGTVNASMTTAQQAMTGALSYSAKTTGAALDNLANTETLVSAAYADAKGRGALTDKILMLAIGMAGLVAFSSVSKR